MTLPAFMVAALMGIAAASLLSIVGCSASNQPEPEPRIYAYPTSGGTDEERPNRIECMRTFAPSIEVYEHGPEAKDGHRERGLRMFRLGDYKTAAVEFERAYNAEPHTWLLFNIGSAHRNAGNDHAALAFYKMFVKNTQATDPSDPLVTETAEHLQTCSRESRLQQERRGGLESPSSH